MAMAAIVLFKHHQLTARDSFVKGLTALINSLPVRNGCVDGVVGTIKKLGKLNLSQETCQGESFYLFTIFASFSTLSVASFIFAFL